jgi:hypothetical protein
MTALAKYGDDPNGFFSARSSIPARDFLNRKSPLCQPQGCVCVDARSRKLTRLPVGALVKIAARCF